MSPIELLTDVLSNFRQHRNAGSSGKGDVHRGLCHLKIWMKTDLMKCQPESCPDLLDRAGLKAPTKTEITKVHQFDIEKAGEEEHDKHADEYLTINGDETGQMREYKTSMREIRAKKKR